jgi:acyl-coenzyme A synthetase/AMP-(fatty) acid ligase
MRWLYDVFEEHKNETSLVWRGATFSYKWLTERIYRWHEQLEPHDIRAGVVVSIEGDYSPESIALLIALIERNAIIVPLTISAKEEIEECRGVAEVHLAISVLSHGDAEIAPLHTRPVEHELLRVLSRSGEPGLVLFSSGSTGKSKAALHNLIPLLAKFKTRRASLTTLAFLMLDHIGGINTLFYVLSNGGTLVTVESRDPEMVCDAISRYRVELLPTSPTFLRLLLISEAYKRYDLSSLKRVTYGTEVMPQRTLDRIHEALPQVELQQTYGLSEVGILRSKSKSGDSLWVRIGGEQFETRVQDGVLWVKAQSAMLGYLNAPSPFDSDGWLNTGDAVQVDGEYIRILGRKSELINVGGQKVHPAEVENVLLDLPNVCDVTVTGETHPITGQIVVAQFNLQEEEDPREFRQRVREYCRGRLASFKTPVRIDIVSTNQFSARYKKMRGTRA